MIAPVRTAFKPITAPTIPVPQYDVRFVLQIGHEPHRSGIGEAHLKIGSRFADDIERTVVTKLYERNSLVMEASESMLRFLGCMILCEFLAGRRSDTKDFLAIRRSLIDRCSDLDDPIPNYLAFRMADLVANWLSEPFTLLCPVPEKATSWEWKMQYDHG